MSKEKISVQNKSNSQGLDAEQELLIDLYQITMAYAYWKSGKAKHQSVFTMSFRHNPFGGGFASNCHGIFYYGSCLFTQAHPISL